MGNRSRWDEFLQLPRREKISHLEFQKGGDELRRKFIFLSISYSLKLSLWDHYYIYLFI